VPRRRKPSSTVASGALPRWMHQLVGGPRANRFGTVGTCWDAVKRTDRVRHQLRVRSPRPSAPSRASMDANDATNQGHGSPRTRTAPTEAPKSAHRPRVADPGRGYRECRDLEGSSTLPTWYSTRVFAPFRWTDALHRAGLPQMCEFDRRQSGAGCRAGRVAGFFRRPSAHPMTIPRPQQDLNDSAVDQVSGTRSTLAPWPRLWPFAWLVSRLPMWPPGGQVLLW